VHSTSQKVSTIIVTCNSGRYLSDCLTSLAAATDDMDHELIVSDNHSTDNSLKIVNDVFPSAVIIRNSQNFGFGKACNVGARNASGEFLLFLNPDMVVDRDAIGSLRKAIQSEAKAGLVSGRLRFPNGSFQPTCRNLPTIGNLVFSRGSILTKATARDGANKYTLGDFPEVTEVPAVAGSMLMVRLSLFRQLGGFDERYFMYMEDTDLSRRATEAGYVNLFVPTAGAIHHWGKGSTTSKIKRKWRHHTSVLKYFFKYHPGIVSWIVMPVLLLGNLLMVAILPERRKGAE